MREESWHAHRLRFLLSATLPLVYTATICSDMAIQTMLFALSIARGRKAWQKKADELTASPGNASMGRGVDGLSPSRVRNKTSEENQ